MAADGTRAARGPEVFALARQRGYSPSAAGRALVRKRVIVRSTCLICRKAMTGLVRRKYCGSACRSKDYRARAGTPGA